MSCDIFALARANYFSIALKELHAQYRDIYYLRFICGPVDGGRDEG